MEFALTVSFCCVRIRSIIFQSNRSTRTEDRFEYIYIQDTRYNIQDTRYKIQDFARYKQYDTNNGIDLYIALNMYT